MIKKPESTSAARTADFNKVAVGDFYNLLSKIYKHQLTADPVYNCNRSINCARKQNPK